MASTSTNKQPLLIDRPLHNSEVLDNRITGTASSVLNGDLAGTNSAILLVDCTQNDGALIEEAYCVSRGANGGAGWIVNLYLSTQNDFLRQEAARFQGAFTASATAGARVVFADFPKTLAPVPNDGSTLAFSALFIPKGKALWAAVNHNGTGMTTGPIVGVQGGFY